MIRVGIVGTENSHALAFARFFNTVNAQGVHPFDNIRVTAIAGDPESNKRISDSVEIAFTTQDPRELLDKVDAVMITSRRGSAHYAQTIPFLKSGLPVFVDKPFTSSAKEATLLLDTIRATGAMVMGGSGCKYAPQVAELKDQVGLLRRENKILSASMGFTVMDSPYDGFWFYAPHLVEMTLEVFGYNPIGVAAVKHEHGVLAELRYQDISVTLHFTKRLPDASCTVYTAEGTIYKRIDISGIYAAEATHFGNMLVNGKLPQPIEQLANHVFVIEAIMKSVEFNGAFTLVQLDRALIP